ncbi:hypothetical protein H4582DRAFT_2079202 [Lactarius indigo]|nr:hypothetical protein H4582DRAFT_2079202 [Lactarius indigo]
MSIWQVFTLAKAVFTGVTVLLLAAKDVAASQDILVDIFGCVECFFVQLDIYTRVPLTPTMTEKTVEFMVEILDILATATKEMEQKIFFKKAAGRTNLEDGLKKLDELTDEEVMAAVQRWHESTFHLLRDPHHFLRLNRWYRHDVLPGPDSVVCVYICIRISIAALFKNSILLPTVIVIQQRQLPRPSRSRPPPCHQQSL